MSKKSKKRSNAQKKLKERKRIMKISQPKERVKRKRCYIRDRAANVPYHVTNRINEKQHLLQPDDVKELFLRVINQAKTKKNFKFALHNLCIMDNHFHMELTTYKKEDISIIMHWIQFVFAMRYNKKTGRTGRLWAGRFKSVIIASKEQVKKVYEYIVNNPVKAGLCRLAEEYKYGYSQLIHHFLMKNLFADPFPDVN